MSGRCSGRRSLAACAAFRPSVRTRASRARSAASCARCARMRLSAANRACCAASSFVKLPAACMRFASSAVAEAASSTSLSYCSACCAARARTQDARACAARRRTSRARSRRSCCWRAASIRPRTGSVTRSSRPKLRDRVISTLPPCSRRSKPSTGLPRRALRVDAADCAAFCASRVCSAGLPRRAMRTAASALSGSRRSASMRLWACCCASASVQSWAS